MRPDVGAAGVHDDALAGLGVEQRHQPHVRELALARVGQVERDHVVPAAQHADPLLEPLALEIRDHGDDAAPLHHALREAEPHRDVGAAPARRDRQQVADDAQRVVTPAPRGRVALDAVREQHRAHAVVVEHRRERQHRRQLDRVVALEDEVGAERLRARDVHGQQQREVALLDELLDVERAHARGHVPVDGAHVVAGLVLAHLGELHAAPLEDRVVGAADPRLEDGAGADLDAPDLREGLAVEDGLAPPGWRCRRGRRRARGGSHASGPEASTTQGTSTCSRIWSTTVSVVMFSASAS